MRRDASDPVLVREGIMKITDGVEWTDDFLNKSSQAYLQLEEMVLTMIDSLFQNSPIAGYFYGSYINDFKKGSVIVLFSIEFKNDTNITHTDESINEAFQGALLNASAFTNLTLDLNSSKIGSLELEPTTSLSTATTREVGVLFQT
uniref:Enteropeptidase-like n=1 Tax=Crassostrea virginica TaxID=6565 RepID=A0A8B8CBV9_CRAVI|nr:enteropeptidase-like [Crassostrea virginica]